MKTTNLIIILSAGAVYLYIGLNFAPQSAKVLAWIPLLVGLTLATIGFTEVIKSVLQIGKQEVREVKDNEENVKEPPQ